MPFLVARQRAQLQPPALLSFCLTATNTDSFQRRTVQPNRPIPSMLWAKEFTEKKDKAPQTEDQ
ncbi:hypothetical protein CVT26_015817 [Gymnopilus dilepis]|uniref:Uncharacterized protein n=1 Tax=Gymnopilus dilepis TaxID=231916 RepID=A0A409WAF9_9AGAR|nr:hypothetical protein CVT26_015817 [Gymnopilus dilepis]